MRYVVSCEHTRAGQDKQRLRDALDALGARCVLRSQWVVSHNGTTCRDLLNHLLRFIDADDRLLVVEIDGTGEASYNLRSDLTAAWHRKAGQPGRAPRQSVSSS